MDANKNWVKWMGLFGSFLSSITFVPQVIQAWESKKVGDLNIYMILIVMTSTIIWLVYGLFHKPRLLPVILCNGVIFFLSVVLLYFKFVF